MRECKTCLRILPVDEFHNYKTRCKECQREVDRKYKAKRKEKYKDQRYRYNYGLTLKEVNERITELDSKCEICGKQRKLVVDHDHETKELRGMLCYYCNTSLALVENHLQEVLAYLTKYRQSVI